MMDHASPKTSLISFVFVLGALTVFGLLWAFVLAPKALGGFGWYIFSYAMGLTMIVLPCTLPLAFVIVPLSLGKGPGKGMAIAFSFGAGVVLMLSLYGALAAALGGYFIEATGVQIEIVKNWVYFIAGAFAYLFALGEIGLIRVRMPSYGGAAPAFIQKQGDYIKAFLLGLFLGNIGVGCPHPATPLIFTEIASSGNIFYGWSLFFVHAIGRIVPLILLAALGILGVNALSWVVAKKDKLERATGWTMVFVAAFILTLGLFTHDWWVNSGQHTLFEEITQEERFLGIISTRLGVALPHTHGLEEGTGLFGLPLWLGNWVLVALWILPLWWYWRKHKTEPSSPVMRFWFAVIISLFLIMIFTYTLPQRFLMRMNDTRPVEDENHQETSQLYEENTIQEGLAVNLHWTPVHVISGTTTKLDFFVNEKPENRPITDLQIDHEKLMHVIGIRSDMNEFFHIHPARSENASRDTHPSFFSIEHVFQKPGIYKIWSEIKSQGVNYVFGHPKLTVEGLGPVDEKKMTFFNNVIIEQYQVSLRYNQPIPAKHDHDLVFDIHTLAGDEVVLENYLGAPMHLSLMKDDLRQFIHTHPEGAHNDREHMMEITARIMPLARAHEGEEPAGAAPTSGADEVVAFRVVFPEPGLYKAFAQFRPQGINLPSEEALTASFWITVEDASAAEKISSWWGLLVSSLILIAVLSYGVSRYVRVQATI